MKRTITSKIIFSYLIIIFVTLAIVGTVFSLSAKRFMERQALSNLVKDARSIAEIFSRDADDGITVERNIRQFIKERVKTRQELGAIESQWAVVGKEMRVLYPAAGEEAQKIRNDVVPQLAGNFGRERPGSARLQLDGNEYMAAILPVEGVNQKIKGWVVLYTPVGPVEQLTKGLLTVFLVSLVFTGMVVVAFGVFFARSLAKPVILLKKRAEKLSKRDFDSRVEIRTGDELEELADTVDRMAKELKEYDRAQKKFLQNASHELKTPLMSIQGYAEGIKDGVFEDDQKALDIIAEESARLKGLVEELIFLSKLETLEDFYRFEDQSLKTVIGKSVEKVNSLALKQNITVNAVMPEQEVVLRADGDKLIQAFINILGNCLRYANRQIAITVKRDKAFARVVIEDDGEGFEQEEIKNVFERFYKGKKGNTGLGLSITKAIVEKHQGSIQVSNGERGGARFEVVLPLGKG